MSRGSRGRSRRRGGRTAQGKQQQKQKETSSSRSGSRRPAKKRPFDPEKHFMPKPIPERSYEACPISGEPVTNIFTAIVHPQTGRPANFDSVLQLLEQQEHLEEGERICYLGKGEFGIVKENPKGKPRFEIRKRIPYEEESNRCEWRKELSPGISRDYDPEPERLSVLHKEAEEVVGNNGFGRSQPPSIYLPKND